MRTTLKYLLAGLLTLSSVPLFAQGGDDCATAMANPINVPFNGSGSTCNGLDDYNSSNVPSTCVSNFYYTGQDWLYYFTATQTGPLQIQISNMNPQPWGSISVWQGCPTSGACIGGVANFSTTLSIMVNVIQGQSYFIMIDCWPTPNCFSYDIDISYIQPPQPQPSCTNMDFETGNYNGWYGTQCNGAIAVGAPNDPTPIYNMTSVGISLPQFRIMTGGVDGCGGFPAVYPGGSYSVRLGDSTGTGSNGCQLIQTFAVTPQNASFTYHYAAVIQDATHLNNEQPFFKIDMFDQNMDTIQCAKYLVVGGPNIPGFFLSNNVSCFQTYYKPWTTVNVDLTAFIGTNVTIQFTVGDCCYGGHFGYAYVDCSCNPYILQTSVDTICTGQVGTITAPPGYGSYSWSPGGQTTQQINVTTAGIYTVWMTSIANPNCMSAISDTVWVFPSPIAGFTMTPMGLCGGDTITFTNTSVIPSGTMSFSWDFGDNSSSTLTNPVHYYSSAGTYTVTLYVNSTPNGCTDTLQQVISLGAGVQSVFAPPPTVCDGTAMQFTDASTANPNAWSWNFGDPSTGPNNISVLQNPSHTFSSPGTYTVTLIVFGGNNCIDTSSQVITIAPIPQPNLTADDTDGCMPHCVNFTDISFVQNPDTIMAWSWNFGDISSNSNTSTLQNPSHCYQFAGTYDVSLTVTSNNGCTATFTNLSYIVVYPLPVADFTMYPNPTTVLDPTVHFTDISTGNPVTWTWTYTDPGTDYIQNPTHTFPADNSGVHFYDVTLEVSDANGCRAIVTHPVEIDPEFTFYVPNCFTPNNDGHNELFYTYGVGITDFDIWIYDRWGNKIWWSSNMDEGWDGKVKGGNSNEVVQEDVYVWKVVLTDVFGKKHRYVGHVSVIK